MKLKDQVVLITGGGTGLGAEMARLFAQEGARIVVTGRRMEKLEEVAEPLRKGGAQALCLAGDVRREEDARRWVEESVRRFGRLDILVNNAGVFGAGGLDTDPEEWDRIMDVNLRGVFLLTRLAAPELKKTKGNILNIASTAGGVRPFSTVLPYCVSKAGLRMFTQCVALELAPFGVRVNVIHPGVVVTDLHRSGGMDEKSYASFLERGKTLHPLGFVGEPADVARLALFLASEEARWITGGDFVIDGGRVLVSAR
jgi:NAD(P)-dependent dehydrogenase (short-subunit alcohol dehydrogenase family)